MSKQVKTIIRDEVLDFVGLIIKHDTIWLRERWRKKDLNEFVSVAIMEYVSILEDRYGEEIFRPSKKK